jgi:hypothetical protein
MPLPVRGPEIIDARVNIFDHGRSSDPWIRTNLGLGCSGGGDGGSSWRYLSQQTETHQVMFKF